MIKAEKLKELIEKKAIIYAFYGKRVIEINLYKDYKFKLDNEGSNDIWLGGDFYTDFDFKDLFETKAEAEFYAKYGNITRIEKMPILLNWNELKQYKQNNDYYSIRWCKNMFEIGIQYLFLVNLKSKNISLGREVDGNINKYLIDEKLTAQSYYKALDKMVELWREEV